MKGAVKLKKKNPQLETRAFSRERFVCHSYSDSRLLLRNPNTFPRTTAHPLKRNEGGRGVGAGRGDFE